MPIAARVRITRTAISPRLATRTVSNTLSTPRTRGQHGHLGPEGRGQAALRVLLARTRSALSTLTSRRFLTVYPGGRLPSARARSGQRPHRGLSWQHFFLGILADFPTR